MAEIVPEEQVQKVKTHLLENLDFEPEQVVNFYTRNIFQRTLAHLVGWTGRASKMLRCTEAGELKTAPTTTGIEYYYPAQGTANDSWGAKVGFGAMASRIDIFVWDNSMLFQIWPVTEAWGLTIEVPPGFYSVDCRGSGFRVMNKTAGQNARYQVIGWW